MTVMSRPAPGTAVFLRTDLTDADKKLGKLSYSHLIHEKYAGRLAIVIQAHPDATVQLFLGIGDPGTDRWWRNEWVTVLCAADGTKHGGLRKLRAEFESWYPDSITMLPMRGSFVRIRTNLSVIEQHCADRVCSSFTDRKATYAGRIGIVIMFAPSYNVVHILFFDDANPDTGDCFFWFHRSWVTVLGNDDIAGLDVAFRTNLQAIFKKTYPDIVIVGDIDATAAAKRAAVIANLNTTIGQIRAQLADLDRIVETLE